MKIVSFFDRVNNLDFQAVTYKLISSQGWTVEKTQTAINRYKLFLYLKSVYPAAIMVPTQEIDAVWHTHIEVNLIQYIRDCDYIFGYILNHCSAISSEQNQEISQVYARAFTTTKALFAEFFGIDALDSTSTHAACADIPMDTKPAVCADLKLCPIPNHQY